MQSKITKVTPLTNPHFIEPIALEYTQNGISKKWEAVLSHDSVSILLYHKELDSFVIVKQLRAPVLNATQSDGMMYELCAGIIDKKMSIQQIAKEEILEECGYDVPLTNIEEISSFYTSVGISGAKQTLFYSELDANMQLNEGGGLEEEDIEVIYIPIKDAKAFMFDTNYKKTPGLMMAFYWFFDRKEDSSLLRVTTPQ